MHVAIPFDVETVRLSWGQASRMWGRVVANHDFVTALAGANGCQRLTLVVPARQDIALLRGTLLGTGVAVKDKVRVVPLADVRGWLVSDPPDVMHVLDPNLWMATHLRNRVAKQPFIVTGVTHSLANQHFLQWALLNDANGVTEQDCLVCTTATAEQVVKSMFAQLRSGRDDFRAPQTRVIPLGVAESLARTTRAACRSVVGLDEQCLAVLSLARFNPFFKMDLQPILRLAALVANGSVGPVRFILAGSSEGDGDYMAYIRNCARQAGVDHLLEFVPNPDEERKALLLGGADVFLSLSDNIQETFGLTVVEAMAAGLPVVASDWNGYRSLVEDGRTGFLIPTRALPAHSSWDEILALRHDRVMHLFSAQSTAVDLEQAAARILQLGADRGLARTMGEAARERAREFTWPLVIEAYLRMWSELLAAESRPQESGRSSALRIPMEFGGYPTAVLGPSDHFRTTEFGERVVAGQTAIHLYFETDEFLDRELMGRILRACTVSAAVSQLWALSERPGPDASHTVNQNIIWLYKQGFLRSTRPLAQGGFAGPPRSD